jgi:serine protease Do
VIVQEVTPSVARGLALSTERGVLVSDVAPDGPAARAGLRRGDVITAVDGKPVDSVGHFRNLVASTAPGATMHLTVARDGREQTLDAAVGELPERGANATPARASAPAPERLGVTVTDITPEVARQAGLSPNAQGVVVTDVAPGGLAAEAGLRPGDVIQEVNRQPVRSAQEFTNAVGQAAARDLVLLVARAGRTAYVVVQRG